MNKVAKLLKYGAVVFFIVSFIGAIVVSNKEEISVEKAKYSWESSKYGTTTKFDGVMFFNSLLTSVVGCALVYGFGELIDIEDRKRRYLVARFGDVTMNNTVESTGNVDAGKDDDSSAFNHKPSSIESALRKAINDRSLETKGLVYDGVNEYIGAYYFKVKKPELSKTVKIEVSIRKSENSSGNLKVRILTKDVDFDVKKEVNIIENILLEHLNEDII